MFSVALLVVAAFTSGFYEVLTVEWNQNQEGFSKTVDNDARGALLWLYYSNRGKLHSSLKESSNISDDVDLKDLVKFYLYTRSNQDNFEELFVDDIDALETSNFQKSIPTKVIIHGYINDITSAVIQNIKNKFLQNDDFNVIGVDWGLISNTIFYTLAAEKTRMVGDYLGTFLDFLVGQGVRVQDLHIIGHSLGAHVAGFAGSNFTSGQIPRITGLDPAKPWFTLDPPDQRLDKSDAAFVDCIHTCGGFLGFLEPLCHADFYPNGGVDPQPGCSELTFGVCSHDKSHEYYAESIIPSHTFYAAKCDAIPNKPPRNCVDTNDQMGFFASPDSHGIFYLETTDSYPFSLQIK